ncbi:MAG: hypothetical protein AAGA22_06715 [Pseudomonadota bacterium]
MGDKRNVEPDQIDREAAMRSGAAADDGFVNHEGLVDRPHQDQDDVSFSDDGGAEQHLDQHANQDADQDNTHRDNDFAGAYQSEFDAGHAEAPDAPTMERSGDVLRNVLVAVATAPFVIILVLIASAFVFNPDVDKTSKPVSARAVKLAVDAENQAKASSAVRAEVTFDALSGEELLVGDGLSPAITLPFEGDVKSVGLDGDRLAILVEGDDQNAIVIHDVLTNRRLAQFQIVGPGERTARADLNARGIAADDAGSWSFDPETAALYLDGDARLADWKLEAPRLKRSASNS